MNIKYYTWICHLKITNTCTAIMLLEQKLKSAPLFASANIFMFTCGKWKSTQEKKLQRCNIRLAFSIVPIFQWLTVTIFLLDSTYYLAWICLLRKKFNHLINICTWHLITQTQIHKNHVAAEPEESLSRLALSAFSM